MTVVATPQPRQRTFDWEFKGVVRLTKIGTTFLVSTLILAIAAVNTGNNALYIAVTFMLGSLLLSGLASKGGLQTLDVEILGIDEAWAMRPAAGRLRIRNRSRLWSVRDLILVSEALAHAMHVPVVPRRGEVTIEIDFYFPRRGLARVSAIEAYTRYPFGFVLKKRRLRVDSEVIVLPRIVEDDQAHERFVSVAGDQSTSSRTGLGSEIHSFREYNRGDSLRHVHWKKSASLGRWIMKQTAVETSHSIVVVVDPWKPPHVSEEAFEEMVTAAASFVHHAARRGFDVTLALPRTTVRARESESTVSLMRALALLEMSRESLVQVLDRDAVVFSVTTPFGTPVSADGGVPAHVSGAV